MLTTANIQRYLRIFLQWAAAYLVTRGVISPTATWVEPVIGAIIGLATFAWTIYGNRVQGLVNEVADMKTTAPTGETIKLVESMKVNDVSVAVAAPANVVPNPAAPARA